jgi:ribosome maturation factor RimP
MGGPRAHFFVSTACLSLVTRWALKGDGLALREIEVIERLISPSLAGMGFRLVRVSFGGGGRPVLQIMAEPANGSPMSVEHCADISRAVSAILDVEDPIPSAYMLEVTSPGIDRPLVSRDDFRRFAGFEAKLELARPVDGRKRLRGRLQPTDAEDHVIILEAAGPVTVPFAEILKAKLILTDDLIAAAQANHAPSADTESVA